ncbi:MAG TPA: hypothetical protein H9994_03475 [Candidatus Salinicoccus merdavium]|nr:hypothetical protein [Candidatus Salinicoccus merdavium]
MINHRSLLKSELSRIFSDEDLIRLSDICRENNVLLEDGDMFGEDSSEFQRICLPSPKPVIKEALERISSQFEDLK